jgi:hypothetical protein
VNLQVQVMCKRAMQIIAKRFIVFLAFSSPFFAYSQKYSIGIKGNPLVTWAGFGDKEAKDVYTRKLRLGYCVGAFVGFPLKKDYNLFLEGGFSQKGRKLLFNNNEWQNTTTYHFTDITLLLRKSYKFKLKKDIPAQWFITAGPQISYWINGKGQFGVIGGTPYKYDIVFHEEPAGSERKMRMTDVNRWLFGLALGVGMKAPIKSDQHITVQLRFVSGHTFLGTAKGWQMDGPAMIVGVPGSFQDTMKFNIKELGISVGF